MLVSGTLAGVFMRPDIAKGVGSGAPYQMAIDADPATPGIQTNVAISGAAPFMLTIDVTQVEATPYLAYQNEWEFPTAGLAMAGSVTEDTAATGLLGCFPYGSGPGVLSPLDTMVGFNGGCRGGVGDSTS